MEDNIKILKVEYLNNHWSDLTQILNLSLDDHTKLKISWNEDYTQRKRTFNGRQHQNIKSGISQQPLVGSSKNLHLSLGDHHLQYLSF